MAVGVTMQLPIDDRHNYYKNYLETAIAILMGMNGMLLATSRGSMALHCRNQVPVALAGIAQIEARLRYCFGANDGFLGWTFSMPARVQRRSNISSCCRKGRSW